MRIPRETGQRLILKKLFLRINENSPRKWPKTHCQKLFISLFRFMSSVKKERDIAID